MSTDEYKQWVLHRKGCRISATKITDSYVKPTELPQAKSLVTKLEKLISNLSDLDSKITSYQVREKLITDDQFESEHSLCEEYQDKLLLTLETAKLHLEELKPSKSPFNQNSSPFQTGLACQKLELPIFEGRPDQYFKFITQFEKILGQFKIDEFSKFSLLEQHLRGDAKLLVSSIPVANLDYTHAKALLDKAYLSKESQQFAVLDRLSKLRMCSSEPFKWISEASVIKDQCTNLAIDTDTVLQYFFWNSLSDSYRQQLVSITNNSRPNLKQIIDNMFEAKNQITELSKDSRVPTVNSKPRKPEVTAMATNFNSGQK